MLSRAYHEAGHAVGAAARGRRVEWLSIEVRGRLGGLCYAVPADAPPVSEKAFRQVQAALAELGSVPSGELLPIGEDAEGSVIQSLAGPAAQRIGTQAGTYDWTRGADDMLYALEVLRFDRREEAAMDFFALLERTNALLRTRWRQVEKLAAALWVHGELNGAAVQEILVVDQHKPIGAA
jgi:hypothetical protein